MSKGPIRRSQLIVPFGVGSMVVVRDGTSVISGGLTTGSSVKAGKRTAEL